MLNGSLYCSKNRTVKETFEHVLPKVSIDDTTFVRGTLAKRSRLDTFLHKGRFSILPSNLQHHLLKLRKANSLWQGRLLLPDKRHTNKLGTAREGKGWFLIPTPAPPKPTFTLAHRPTSTQSSLACVLQHPAKHLLRSLSNTSLHNTFKTILSYLPLANALTACSLTAPPYYHTLPRLRRPPVLSPERCTCTLSFSTRIHLSSVCNGRQTGKQKKVLTDQLSTSSSE